jgi:hypothetical protein
MSANSLRRGRLCGLRCEGCAVENLYGLAKAETPVSAFAVCWLQPTAETSQLAHGRNNFVPQENWLWLGCALRGKVAEQREFEAVSLKSLDH